MGAQARRPSARGPSVPTSPPDDVLRPHARAVLGTFGIDLDAMDEVEEWLVTDRVSATSQTGRIRRVARAAWPGLRGTEVWVLGTRGRRLPLDAYTVLTAFLDELARKAA